MKYSSFPCKLLIVSALTLITIFTHRNLSAAPVSPDEALSTANNWLIQTPQPLGAKMFPRKQTVETFRDQNQTTLCYIVPLSPSGFIIVSPDTTIEPIIAFSPTDSFNVDPDSPLVNLLTRDMQGRLTAGTGKSLALDSQIDKAEMKWQSLLSTQRQAAPVDAVDDPRVMPLVDSRWGQSNVSGNATYNYYTPQAGPTWTSNDPNNYVCGCVATAMAQLMRYHQHPTGGVGTGTYWVVVDGTSVDRDLRGGDGAGGAYNWADMVLVPDATITQAQREAVGALTYDAGLSVHMSYTAADSGTDTLKAADALVNVFSYQNAVAGWNGSGELVGNGLTKMVNPNLDIGRPVLLGITGVPGGHAIVCDGYGFNDDTAYHHLNMGWSGSDDTWYNLPDIDTGGFDFTIVYKCVYNVFPADSGKEIVSGRVLDFNGLPVEDAVVTIAVAGETDYTDTTDSRGIYGGLVPSGDCYTVSCSGYKKILGTVGTSVDMDTTVGNVWGINFGGAYPREISIERASVADDGTEGNGRSIESAISSDGRYVAFSSDATNLIDGDTTGGSLIYDVFVYDRTNDVIQRVSQKADGTGANGNSWAPSISGDGRYVVFSSRATNLLNNVDNGIYQIYRYDRNDDSLECLSMSSATVEGNFDSMTPDISSDGAVTAYISGASNLAGGDANGFDDVYYYKHSNGSLNRVLALGGAEPNETSYGLAISGNGRYITFASFASNYVAGDTNNRYDIFLYDIQENTVSRVSMACDGSQSNGHSFTPDISSDGRYIVFQSEATNLVEGDTNGKADIFLFDTQQNTIISRVSTATDGTQSNNESYHPAISGDGSSVVFDSLATNLVSETLNGASNVYVVNYPSGKVTCVNNLYTGSAEGAFQSQRPDVSSDGSFVSFDSDAWNLVPNDTNIEKDVFVATFGTTPTVTTTAASNVTASTATSGGNVTSEGGASVTAKGVCWSTSANPTTSDSKTTDGSGTGSFTSSITGLSAGTTYHVRAYATNSAGTAYGSDVSFTTSATTFHVCSDGSCGGQPNCHETIAEAVAAAQTGAVIKVANDVTYSGNVTVTDRSLTIQGGWDTSFSGQSGTTTLEGTPVVTNGSVTLQSVNIVP